MPRHPADIDGEQVRKLAAFGCTYKEIGAWFGVDEKTIRNRFSLEKQQGEENGKLSLRRRQHKRAMEGSDTMLIHLGKHRLGQADKIEVKNTSDGASFESVENPRDQGIQASTETEGVREE